MTSPRTAIAALAWLWATAALAAPLLETEGPPASNGMGAPWSTIGFPPAPPWDVGLVSTPWNGKAPNDVWVSYRPGPDLTLASARDAWRDVALAQGFTVTHQGDSEDRSYSHLSRVGARLDIDVSTNGSWVNVDLHYEAKRVVSAAWEQASWCAEGTRPGLTDGPQLHACYEIGTEGILDGDYAKWAVGADIAGPPTITGRYAHGEPIGEWTLEPVTDDDVTYTVHAVYAEDGSRIETYRRVDGTVAAVFTVPSRRKGVKPVRAWAWYAPDGTETAHAAIIGGLLTGTVGRLLPASSVVLWMRDQFEVLDVDVASGRVAYRAKVLPESEVEWQDCGYAGLSAPYLGVTLGLLDVDGRTDETFVVYEPAGPRDACTTHEAASESLGRAKDSFAAVGLSTTAMPVPSAPGPRTGNGWEGSQTLAVAGHVAELTWSRDNYDTDAFVERVDEQVGGSVGEGAIFASWTWDGVPQDRFIAGYARANGGGGSIEWWGAFAGQGDAPPLIVLRYDQLPYQSTYTFLRPLVP